jgi:hypothetical protein
MTNRSGHHPAVKALRALIFNPDPHKHGSTSHVRQPTSSPDFTHRYVPELLQLQPHLLVLLLHALDLIIINGHLAQSLVLVLENVQLCTHVPDTTAAPLPHNKKLLEVLDFALELLNKGIILSIYFVSSDALDN